MSPFCFCSTFWYNAVEHHNLSEETVFSPAVERIVENPGLMEQNVEPHRAFHPGFHHFRDYCTNTRPGDHNGMKLRATFEDLSAVPQQHLDEEIDTLLAIDYCDKVELKRHSWGWKRVFWMVIVYVTSHSSPATAAN